MSITEYIRGQRVTLRATFMLQNTSGDMITIDPTEVLLVVALADSPKLGRMYLVAPLSECPEPPLGCTFLVAQHNLS